MSAVESIKAAIEKLSVEERAEITAELCGWTDDDWDRQMKADGAAGKFASLNREADGVLLDQATEQLLRAVKQKLPTRQGLVDFAKLHKQGYSERFLARLGDA
jgi:hypothetical protein